jgi:flavin reductase (DIM6/NTAB) family NADH-FMN oxidoreductase RutF
VTIDPSNSDTRSVYQLLIGAIVPRPIAFVSTISLAGIVNLAPFSFFTAASANPPVICFCPMVRANGSTKDTLNNICETREFVVNIVSEEISRQMNICSGDYPPEVDEFAVSGLTPIASEVVKPPRVKESRVQMECRLVQIVQISIKPLGGSMVLLPHPRPFRHAAPVLGLELCSSRKFRLQKLAVGHQLLRIPAESVSADLF